MSPPSRLAEEIGYSKVVDLAHASGISEDVKPRLRWRSGPTLQLRSKWPRLYNFPNGGMHVQPSMIAMLKEPGGKLMFTAKPETKQISGPPANYLLVNLLEEVCAREPLPAFDPAASSCRRPVRRNFARTAGLPGLPLICFASFGLASTTTGSSISKARTPRCPSGPNS